MIPLRSDEKSEAVRKIGFCSIRSMKWSHVVDLIYEFNPVMSILDIDYNECKFYRQTKYHPIDRTIWFVIRVKNTCQLYQNCWMKNKCQWWLFSFYFFRSISHDMQWIHIPVIIMLRAEIVRPKTRVVN